MDKEGNIITVDQLNCFNWFRIQPHIIEDIVEIVKLSPIIVVLRVQLNSF